MARAGQKQKKLAVLEVIKEKKEILFGSFQNNSTAKAEKKKAWTEVLDKAKSLGLATANREWTYARDHLFGLWKSRTLSKRDNAKRTGTVGGKNVIMDEIDNSILEIMGRESPQVCGLGLPESDGVRTTTSEEELEEPTTSRRMASKRPVSRSSNENDLTELKRAVLESKLYKNKLKILALERNLGLKRSKFTEEFEERNK